jgi:hypothetical protein
MALSEQATSGLATTLGFTPGGFSCLIASAYENGSATGQLDTEDTAPMAGVLVTVHHAGDRKFNIELH